MAKRKDQEGAEGAPGEGQDTLPEETAALADKEAMPDAPPVRSIYPPTIAELHAAMKYIAGIVMNEAQMKSFRQAFPGIYEE